MSQSKPSAEEFRRMVETYTRQIDGYRRRTQETTAPSMTDERSNPAKLPSDAESFNTNDPAPEADVRASPVLSGAEKTSSPIFAPMGENAPAPSPDDEVSPPETEPPASESPPESAPLASAGTPPESNEPGDSSPRLNPPLPAPSAEILRPRPVWAREKQNAPRYGGPIPPDKEDPGGLSRLPAHYLPLKGDWGVSPPYIASAEGLAPEQKNADGAYPPLGGQVGAAKESETDVLPDERMIPPVPNPPAPPESRPLNPPEPERPPAPPSVGSVPPGMRPAAPKAPPPPMPPLSPPGVNPQAEGLARLASRSGQEDEDAPEWASLPVRMEIPVQPEKPLQTGRQRAEEDAVRKTSDPIQKTDGGSDAFPERRAGGHISSPDGRRFRMPPGTPKAFDKPDASADPANAILEDTGLRDEKEEIFMQRAEASRPEEGLGQPFSRSASNRAIPAAGFRAEHGCRVPQNEKPGARRVYAGQTFTGDRMTNASGAPVPDDGNTQTVGRDGPAVMSDAFFLQKMAHFDRERIPERVVHAKGAGAFGVFESYGDASDLTMAAPFRAAGKRTQVAVRFSTVIGSRGSADTARDPRGFAVRFYTEDGNWDLVGNNMPVFFIRDAVRFPDLIHSLKPDPVSELTDRTRFWDFASLSPEAMHMIMWVYSDYGTLDSFRFMNGFGVNTFTLANRAGKLRLCKFHWLSKQGVRTLTQAESDRIAAEKPDAAREDLRCAIERGEYPRWELCVQTMTLEDAEQLEYDPLDDTKVWDEKAFPLQRLGMMTLNRNPDNFFLQVEEAAYCPANMIPGVQPSADKMLTGRIFSYQDTQRHRIGANFEQIPVNMPRRVPMNNQQDGPMAISNPLGSVNYAPNSLNGDYPRADAALNRPGAYFGGSLVRQGISRGDDFTQAGEQYRSYTDEQRKNLTANIASELRQCNKKIQGRILEYAKKCDEGFCQALSDALA